MAISIFAQPAHTNTNPSAAFDPTRPSRGGHLQRVSSIIRGQQIAERLGARLNPTGEIDPDDICIYVKPHVKNEQYFCFEGHPYLDIIDGWALLPLLARNPRVWVIACSVQDGATLRLRLPNPVTVIPQHHCNFERAPRTREGVTRVGVIGALPAFDMLPAGLSMALAERGIELETFSKFYTRQDIIDFYQRIDVQVVWRPQRMRLSNPLKIVNAAAFGVPTIAWHESVFDEVGDCYVSVQDFSGLLGALDDLRNVPELYSEISGYCVKRAERYHIDNVCEQYRRLT